MPLASPPTSDVTARCQLCAARLECLIGRLPRAQLERLLPLVREHAFRKGDLLQTQDRTVSVMRSIKLGSVMLTRSGPDGQPRPVALVGRAHLLGLAALMDGSSQVGAEAVSSGRYCEVPADALRTLLTGDPSHLAGLNRYLLQVLSQLADWSQVMRLRGLPRQLMAALMLMADDQGSRTVRLPNQVTLAALLSTTRESVARALRRLDETGHLRRIDRWHCELTDRHLDVFLDEAAR